ncbi:hypothetical protein D6789_00420 [Candidatus Woesearchaeota archaeon]|nr:MAG: hypothetical protein D6789_00420 [Candidatus Woesearchaeota archaeon]
MDTTVASYTSRAPPSVVFAYDSLIGAVRAGTEAGLERILNGFLVLTVLHPHRELEEDALKELEKRVATLAEENPHFQETPTYAFAVAVLGERYELQELFAAITALDLDANPEDYQRAIAYARRLEELGWHAGKDAVAFYTNQAVAAGALTPDEASRIAPRGFSYDPRRFGDRLNAEEDIRLYIQAQRIQHLLSPPLVPHLDLVH